MRTFTRALVTGGAGFVGSHLCEALLRSGTEVVCIDDLSTGLLENIELLNSYDGFTFVRHDITEAPPDMGGFDLVAHLACPASPLHYARLGLETLRVGSDGTRHALDIARAHSARFLLASTSEVYGDPHVHPQSESYWGNVNPIGPRSVYDESKRYAEALTAAYARYHGTDVTIARIFNTYGPRMRTDDGRMIPAFVQQALTGQPLTVNGDGTQTRSVCHVSDTVRGLLALAGSDHPGPVNIGNPGEMSVAEMAKKVIALCDSPSTIEFREAVADDPQRRCPDITLARESLGWAPEVEPEEGLCSTIDWFSHRLPVPPAEVNHL
jgi:dTDP-glucose 4,6-dehydratase